MENSPFAKLSKELRDIIYAYALPDPLDVLEISRGHKRPKVNITQLCGKMREEALRTPIQPYKLCIAMPMGRAYGASIEWIVDFARLLEEANSALKQLPVLFLSKPTTIHLCAVVRTDRSYPSSVRYTYEWSKFSWERVRKTVQHLTQLTHAHKLILVISCKYILLSHNVHPAISHWCPRDCQLVSDLDRLHVEVAVAEDFEAAKGALSRAVAELKEAIKLRTNANHARLMRGEITRALEKADEIMTIFMECLSK